MNYIKHIVTLGLLVSLPACNYLGGENGLFRERTESYFEAQTVPPMRIPAELDSYTIDELYVIPEELVVDADVFYDDIPLPMPIEARRREGVILQSLSDKSWILIDATPGQVWPRIRDYWTELQIELAYENPSAGIMETAWVELGSDRENRHKYRIMIEPGLHSGYSEIYVRHLQNLRTDPIPPVITWPEESSSPDLEQDMLRSVSQFLADRNDIYQASSASLLAGTIQAESKANLVNNGSGSTVLELKVDYNRAWVQVRQALDSAEIEIVEPGRAVRRRLPRHQAFLGALAQAALQRNVRRFAFVVRPQARLPLRFRRLRGRLQGYVTLR